MICEMFVEFTVCCVAPPGAQDEIKYQLTNPLNIIYFQVRTLSYQNDCSSGLYSFVAIALDIDVSRIVSSPFLLLVDKNKRIVTRSKTNFF